MSQQYKLHSTEVIDRIVSAEIPDKDTDPFAFETVHRCMIHGPYGVLNPTSPCIINERRSKRYPRDLNSETNISENGYPLYQKHTNGRTIIVGGHELDNRWIIPYNVDFVRKYDAHINVKKDRYFHVVKYFYKYIHKDPNMATIVIENNTIPLRNHIEHF